MKTIIQHLIKKGFEVSIGMGDDGYIYIEAKHPDGRFCRGANPDLEKALYFVSTSSVYKEA